MPGHESDFARDHGPGACTIRFTVRDPAAVEKRLESLGVPHAPAAAVDGTGDRLIRPAEFALGTAFEFVEWDGS